MSTATEEFKKVVDSNAFSSRSDLCIRALGMFSQAET